MGLGHFEGNVCENLRYSNFIRLIEMINFKKINKFGIKNLINIEIT
jgi:hypothetical protein